MNNIEMLKKINKSESDIVELNEQLEHNTNNISSLSNLILYNNYKEQLENCRDGSYIIFPWKMGGHQLTETINIVNKNITIDIRGDILDRCTNIPIYSTNVVDLNGMGLITFNNCKVTIIQRDGTVLDGGSTTNGVSSTQRGFFVGFKCKRFKTNGLNVQNVTGSPVATIGCSNIIEYNGNHTNTDQIAHISCTNTIIDNVIMEEVKGRTGILVQNRGILDNRSDWSNYRPNGVVVKNCSVNGVNITNDFALGISIDSSDYFTCTNNKVNGKNKCSMAFSFADSKNGKITDNQCLDFANATNGTYNYCGIGMELERTENIRANNNIFTDTLIGYLINNSKNVNVNGSYTLSDPENSITSTGASNICFASIKSNSENITVSGDVYNCKYGIVIGSSKNVFMRDLNIIDFTSRGILTIPLTNGLIENCNFDNVYIQAKSSIAEQCIDLRTDCYSSLFINNLRLIHKDKLTSNNGIVGYSTNGTCIIKNLYANTLNEVMKTTSGWKNLYIDSVDMYNVNSINTGGGVASYSYVNIRKDGKFLAEGGDSKILWKSVAPTGSDIGFRGQKWIDSSTKKEYTYMDSWVLLN